MAGRIGKYTIHRELGRGGFGQVFLALDPDIGRKVAIKVLLADGDREKLQRFQAEIGTTGNLRHKNIVTIYGSGEESGNPYLVMELLEGETLREVITNRAPFSILDKVKMMTQVAEGLAHAHSQGVVHRDVKPENIMLLRDGTVKIMDFGIALAANRTTTMTQSGFMVGTMRYMAPEQLMLAEVKANEQTDIFAFGDVYYELITGRHPFVELVRELGVPVELAIANYDPKPVTGWIPECPDSLDRLIRRALAKNPAFRYKKFSEIVVYGQQIVVDLQHDRVIAILADASHLLESSELEAARSKAQEAELLEPWNHDARRLRESIDRQIQNAEIRNQVANLLAESEQRIADRRFPEAVQCLDSAARLDSNNETVRRRLAEAQARLARYVRANSLVEEARAWEDQRQFGKALELLQTAVGLEPDHTEAERLLRRVRDKLKQEREVRFQAAVAKTRSTLQAGDLERAADMIAHLSTHFADEPGAAEVLPGLQQLWEALQSERQIAAYGDQAKALNRKKAYREAVELLTEALRKYPQEPELQRLRHSAEELWKAQERSEAIAAVLQSANRLRQDGELDKALAAISEGRQEVGEDPAFILLTHEIEIEREDRRRAAALVGLLSKARELMAAGRYTEAIEQIERDDQGAKRSLAADAQVQVLLESAWVSRAAATAQAAVSPGDREQALAAVQRTLERYPSNGDLQKLAEDLAAQVDLDLRQQSIAKLRQAVRAEIDAVEYERASRTLQQARLQIPGNSFDDLAEEIESHLVQTKLQEVESQVCEYLAANRLAEAVEQLEATRSKFARDPRWKRLLQELAARCAYERVIEEAEQHRREGDLDAAEAALAGVVSGSPDRRASQMLEAIQTERAEGRRREAERAEARRCAYERAIEEAEQHRRAADLDPAEAVLAGVVSGSPDRRASQMLEAIRAERAEARRREAERAEARRCAYERAIEEAEQHRRDGDLDAAEATLAGVVSGSPDRRASQILEAIRTERLDAATREAERVEAQRCAYERAIEEAEQHRRHGDLDAAEATLAGVVSESPDRRAGETLEAIQAQRLEVARLGAERIRRGQQASTQFAESGALQTTPIPTDAPSPKLSRKAVATIAAAVMGAAVIGVMVYKLTHQPKLPVPVLISFEVRTDPPGASVKLGEQSCVTPTCRFNLAPGEYQLQAQLDGFEPVQQTLTADAAKNPGLLELSLKPVPPPRPTTKRAGTLVIRAGQPSALIRIDDKPLDRTGPGGELSLSLDANTYRVTVEKERYYVTPASRKVTVGEDRSQTVEFTLTPKDAKLVLTGAPAGAEVRVGNRLLGRASGASETAFSIKPGTQTLQFTLAGTSNTIHREFQPDETARVSWSEVAPAPSAAVTKDKTPTPAEPTPEEREAQDWAQIRDTRNPAELRGYLAVHLNGAHRSDAQALLDKLTAPPPTPDERPAIRAALDEYLRSLQTKDENTLRAAWPQIPSSEMDKWKTDFRNTKEIRIQPLNQPTYDITGNTARVDWRLQTEKSYPSSPTPYMGERNTRFTLRKDNGRWVIQSVR